jgi:sterol desaturase/sphingolipid hydroxylase (fatty acid hydroxylase superfamily)
MAIINSLWISLLPQVLWAIVAIVFAELVRDAYHMLGHYWLPIQRNHMLHHKVFRRDLTITSMDLYKKAQIYNDLPEGLAMLALTAAFAGIAQQVGGGVGAWVACLYVLMFIATAIARANGLLMQTDLTHMAGDLTELPKVWTVNRTYHWRHHFDEGRAFYSGHFTIFDKLLGTSLNLDGKTVAVTGASGQMGRALIAHLRRQNAKVIALTSSQADFPDNIRVKTWQLGEERSLLDLLQSVDILVLNHGVNVYGDRRAAAIQQSFEVNVFSSWRLAELFLETVTRSEHKALKELWVNTSEAEVNPALSPLYELSKRTLGDLITLRRLDAPCVIRKLVLGPFKSKLNPYGVMSADWVAGAIVALAKRDVRNIIVTVNPLTYLTFPLKELSQSLYFRLFSQSPNQPSIKANLSPPLEKVNGKF